MNCLRKLTINHGVTRLHPVFSINHHPAHYKQRNCMSTSTQLIDHPMMNLGSSLPPVLGVQTALNTLHDTLGGTSWGGSIMLGTLVIRTIISFPLSTWSRKIFASYGLTIGPLVMHQHQFLIEVRNRIRQGIIPKTEGDKLIVDRAKFVREQKDKTILHHNNHPFKGFLLVLLEVSFWMSYIFAIRNNLTGFPLSEASHIPDQMKHQGFLWFTDLTIPDPLYLLPIISSTLFLTTSEFMAEWRRQNQIPDTTFLRLFKYFGRGATVFIFFVATQMPAGITLYWVTNAALGLSQAIIFSSPQVQNILRIPRAPNQPNKNVNWIIWFKKITGR